LEHIFVFCKPKLVFGGCAQIKSNPAGRVMARQGPNFAGVKKQGLLFLKKKKQKDFIFRGRWRRHRQIPQESKVFWLLFFKKVTSSFCFHPKR